MSNFIHLHTHSDYSPQDGAQSTEQIANKAAKLGMNAVALTDHGRCGGMLQFKKACQKAEVKPIYGFEAYVAPESRFTKSKLDDHKKTSYHLTLLAKDEEGLRNIFRLTSIGWLDGFYYKPRIDNEVLREHSSGLVVLSGCPAGRLSQFLLDGKDNEAAFHIGEMLNIFKDDFYIEVQNHGFDWEQDLKTSLFEMAAATDIPIVGTQDSHYENLEDAEMHGAICKLAAGDLEFGTDQLYFKSREEMEKMFDAGEHHCLDITQEIADKCNCEWQHDKTIWPVYDLPAGKTSEETLREITYKGFGDKFREGTEEYKERIEYELGIIEKMGFATYFLVVADFINWAKSKRIPVGPGRGSGAGSLVCYCIGITDVEPIKYGLYFERFLNPARVSLPDLDIDFCKERRGEVIEYVREKYGEEKVAQIGTYAVFKPRGSLRDFARVLGCDRSVGDELAAMVPPDVAGKALSFDEVIEAEPKLLKTNHHKVVELARKAENLNKQAGVHAAGVIISDSELRAQVPLFRGKHDEVTSQFDMHDVEDIGLVKYDFLGLKNLTVIQETIDLVKQHRDIDIDISEIPENDQEVFTSTFQQGKLDGIFQFETSSGFRDLCIKVRPESIDDLSTITALFRPGPLGTGLTEQFVKGRNGAEIEYVSEHLRPILSATCGVMVYQEQIMRICTDIAGYTLAEADNMRKIIGKKLPEKMKLERTKFVQGCVDADNDFDETMASKMFDDIEGFAKYSFNKAHSVAYSVISYQTAWLKTHYPKEFYTALLNSSFKDQDDLVKYIYSCKEDKIPIMPPDVNVSEAKFTLSNGTIVFGLAGLKGLGAKACQTIVEERKTNGPFKSIQDMVGRKINKGALKALANCGALAEITELSREQLVENLEELFKYYTKLAKWEKRNINIAAREKEIQEWNKNPVGTKPRKLPKNKEKPEMPDVGEASNLSRQDRLSLERQTLGFYLTGHPMDDYPGLSRLSKYNVSELKEGTKIKQADFSISIPVVLCSITPMRTRNGANMGIIKIEDKSGRIEATIFPKQWKKLKDKIKEDRVSIVRGSVKTTAPESEDSPPIVRLFVNDIDLVEEDAKGGKVEPLNITLQDNTQIKFIPKEEVNFSAYQQALALSNNMKRMV